MPVALETFLSQLLESGILSDQKLRVVEHKKTTHKDGESLAREMIKSGHLTKYQAEQILGGKGKNLCMGQYVLLEKLGAGGMGQVYKAYHPGMERLVAIKVILAKGKINDDVVKRFEREVKAAAKLSHPNIITVYDAGNANGRIFMVMEYIKGCDLGDTLQNKGFLDVSEVVNYILQVAKGLKYAHDQGVIHRDIKPANILLDLKGNIKIVDMGLAKIENKENEETVSILTGNAVVMGTVDFMSPEQGESAKNVDARADIYSLGASLFYLLTGNVMYPGKTAFGKLMAHRDSEIPSLCSVRPDVPIGLEIIFRKMVAKKVGDRYTSMDDVISVITNILPDIETINNEKSIYSEKIVNDKVDKNTTRQVIKSTVNRIGGQTLQFLKFYKTKFSKSVVLTISGLCVLGLILLVSFVFLKSENKLKNLIKTKKTQVVDLGNGVKLDLVLIPSGKFMMGSPEAESGRRDDESRHEVTITKPFYMGMYEVTQEQWKSVMGKNSGLDQGANLPVTDVSWEDCQDFIKKLNTKKDGGYRLPTEAEWEYACRGGTIFSYSFGRSISKLDANYDSTSISKVGMYKPNAFGLYDMHGNVWEWCNDWYGPYWIGSSPTGARTDPIGPTNGERRVLRGGAFIYGEMYSRSSCRYDFKPSQGFNYLGFRLARTN